jgi:F-type H+-transporting ATPase subunit b
MVSTYALASSTGADAGGTDTGSTDIVQRTVNFLIFAGILYYLLAEPLKNYFSGRSAGIEDELVKVQKKMLEVKEARKAAEQKIVEAEKFAAQLVETSKKENKLISEKIAVHSDAELENVSKQHSALMELEQRNMVRSTVENVMHDVLTGDSSGLDKDSMANIVMKKVA